MKRNPFFEKSLVKKVVKSVGCEDSVVKNVFKKFSKNDFNQLTLQIWSFTDDEKNA